MSEPLHTADAADVPLDRDLPCMRCGYNLRTRRPSDLCPECGLSVQHSILAFRARPMLPHPVPTAVGILVLSLGFAVRCISLILASFLFPWRALAISSAARLLHVLLIAFGGTLLFASARGNRNAGRTLRTLLLFTFIAYIGLAAGDALLNLLLSTARNTAALRIHPVLATPFWFRIGLSAVADLLLAAVYGFAVPLALRFGAAVRARGLGIIVAVLLALLAAIQLASLLLLGVEVWAIYVRFPLASWQPWYLRSVLRLTAATCDAGLAIGSFLLAFQLLLFSTGPRAKETPA